MQMHRLRLAAIGPFAEPVEIDLDRLSASGIFLLEGPTGAGKSTLIDAIVFALYGDVAGRSSSSDRIASAVAPEGVKPSVELDFSTSHGMFRVQRTPKHQRRKRRGNGMTVENASAKLWRLVSPDATSVGEPVSTRIDEIGAEILDIVGLSRDQFAQTVVLPQGEFATFLRADAEHRRELLQRLFGTEVYDRTVDRLIERRRVARQQRASAATAALGAVRAYGGAVGASGDDEEVLVALFEDDPEQLLVVIQQQLDAVAASASAASTAVAEQSKVLADARVAYSEMQTRDRARRRVIELRAKLQGLDETAMQLAADVERLRLADAATSLMPTVGGLLDAQKRAALAERSLASARDELPRPDVATEQWPDRERVVTQQIAELGVDVEVERGLDSAKAHVAELQTKRTELHDQMAKLSVVVEAAPAELAELRRRADTASATQATLESARDRLETSTKLLHAARELHTLTERVDEVRHRCETERAAAQQLLHQETALRSRFIDGMAGHLASQLQTDEPCPVCGSREHPEPASRADDDVDRAAVDAAAESTSAATLRLEATRQELQVLEAAAAELRGVVGGVGVSEALDRVKAADAGVAIAVAAEAEVVRVHEELSDAEQQLAERREQLFSMQQQGARLGAVVEAAEANLARDLERVSQAAGSHPTVTARVDALERQAVLWRKALEAVEFARAASRDVEVRSSEAHQALEASPFDDAAEAHAASLTASRREELADSIKRRTAARTECEAQLQSPELAGVDVEEHLDLQTLQDFVAEAERELQTAQAHAGQLAQRLTESRARAAELQTSLSAQRAVADATTAVIRIADLVSAGSSDNAKAMSLPTFVLRERFVDVVASANSRLATMSDGRYRLEHVEGRRGNRKSGLELHVRDTHTEHPRDPATLSGGESFYCSLALALGLADAVTSEAGGVDLGTLFVDEGFGSLDADTLDQVLEVLQGLATSGRAVGIVSHVPELKEQIAERISVVPNRDGSSRLIVAA
jgi:exonuclease SbcC